MVELKVVEVRVLRFALRGKIHAKVVGPGVNVKRYFVEGDLNNQQMQRKVIQSLEERGLIEERDSSIWATEQGRIALNGYEEGIAERRRAQAPPTRYGSESGVQAYQDRSDYY